MPNLLTQRRKGTKAQRKQGGRKSSCSNCRDCVVWGEKRLFKNDEVWAKEDLDPLPGFLFSRLPPPGRPIHPSVLSERDRRLNLPQRRRCITGRVETRFANSLEWIKVNAQIYRRIVDGYCHTFFAACVAGEAPVKSQVWVRATLIEPVAEWRVTITSTWAQGKQASIVAGENTAGKKR